MKQGTEEWLTYRKNKIGASDAPIILGVSPYKTAYQLWMEKVHNVNYGTNFAMNFGRKNEDRARCLFEELSGFIVFGCLSPIVNPEIEWQIASLDGISPEGDIIVEIKCANAKDHAIAQSGNVPTKYMPQLQHQLSVTGLPSMYYFSYHKGEGEIVLVNRDEAFIKELIEKESDFYHNFMLTKLPPPMVDRDKEF